MFGECSTAELSLQTGATSLVPVCVESSYWLDKSELEPCSQLPLSYHSKVSPGCLYGMASEMLEIMKGEFGPMLPVYSTSARNGNK